MAKLVKLVVVPSKFILHFLSEGGRIVEQVSSTDLDILDIVIETHGCYYSNWKVYQKGERGWSLVKQMEETV